MAGRVRPLPTCSPFPAFSGSSAGMISKPDDLPGGRSLGDLIVEDDGQVVVSRRQAP